MVTCEVDIKKGKRKSFVISGYDKESEEELDRLLGEDKVGTAFITFFKEGFVVANRVLEFELDGQQSKPLKKTKSKKHDVEIYG